MKIEQIAKVCHEANRAFCQTIGDDSQTSWEEAPEWQRSSAINGVKMHIENPEAGASASHEYWMKEKVDIGWKYGPVKDADKKEHPCILSFNDLPFEQQLKDVLFRNIVHALFHDIKECSINDDTWKKAVLGPDA